MQRGSKPRLKARGVLPAPVGGTKIEREYAERLEVLRRAGEVAWYRFEPITLLLAPDTRFTGDFGVMLADRSLEIHECKPAKDASGTPLMRDDSWAKLKTAAALFPFTFRLCVRLKSGGWAITEVPS